MNHHLLHSRTQQHPYGADNEAWSKQRRGTANEPSHPTQSRKPKPTSTKNKLARFPVSTGNLAENLLEKISRIIRRYRKNRLFLPFAVTATRGHLGTNPLIDL